MAPAASEDLQALANQGVMPEGLVMDECPDLVPIAGTSSAEQIWDSIMKKDEELATKRKAADDTFAVPESKKPRRIRKRSKM